MDAYLASLTDKERKQLEEEAVQQADPLFREHLGRPGPMGKAAHKAALTKHVLCLLGEQ